MQRKDGTYDLPDASVSRVWQSEGGMLLWAIRKSDETLAFWENRGYRIEPQPGRWLPWQPPTFPVRKKNPIRLCIADFRGIRQTAAWFEGRPFEFVTKHDGYKACEAKNIEWLTPEYEDEV